MFKHKDLLYFPFLTSCFSTFVILSLAHFHLARHIHLTAFDAVKKREASARCAPGCFVGRVCTFRARMTAAYSWQALPHYPVCCWGTGSHFCFHKAALLTKYVQSKERSIGSYFSGVCACTRACVCVCLRQVVTGRWSVWSWFFHDYWKRM